MRRRKKPTKVKIRKSIRQFYIIALLAIIVVSLYVLYDSFNAEDKRNFIKENIYEYTNKYLYSYDISMLENQYVTEEKIADKNVYITDLMDMANVNMTYIYNANQASDITYNYRIIGNLQAIYTKNGEQQKVLKDTDVLVENKEFTVNSNKIEISENFDLNLNEKVQMIKGFQQELGIQVDTTYTVLLEISTTTSILGQEVTNVYSPDLVFDITSKTTTVKTTTEDSAKPQVITKMVKEDNEISQIRVAVATIIMLISIVLLVVIRMKTVNGNIIRNEYKIELNRILKDCSEKIVEVNARIETDGQGLVDVKEFEEIIKVSEELFKPILYWNNEKEEESWFCVIGNNMVYRFVLKR